MNTFHYQLDILLLLSSLMYIFFSHKNPELLMHKVNIELCKLTCWLQANKLSLNIKKTKFMVFRPRQKRLTLDNFAVKLCDTNIE